MTFASNSMKEVEMECYVCINCGKRQSNLYKKYDKIIKTINCDQCHKTADKYIEFEPVIIIVDFMLLSHSSYRHALHNRDFKLFWKLSLILLLLESLTLWRGENERKLKIANNDSPPYEHGFYNCCAYKIGEFLLCTMLMVIANITLGSKPTGLSVMDSSYLMMKAYALANFSKFFLLPIMLWRENTTEFGASLHRFFVTAHHLCALVSVYIVVSRCRPVISTVVVISIYVLKEYLMTQYFAIDI
ncbi:protein ARV1-like isoform X1 [Musca domestica]|uniref:Protein ARV n=1 Tax=Musca domestica TaxID=7370 RepID=A0A1I8MSC0_MUSDO|nr:protein ARV1 isoform X1 [Musca domestica]XP_058976726.1 protein ARV1-like isoform X1 [Musca domestica]